MNQLRIESLTIQTKRSKEIITFSGHVDFFHGQISSGKSSIARLIDFCLGGGLEITTAISQEVSSASINAQIGNNSVSIMRTLRENNADVTWRDADGRFHGVTAPLQALVHAAPIFGNSVYSMSDLLFMLLGLRPIMVKRSKGSEHSPMVRLSFRDVMWYCYLDQDHIDSSFYRMDDPFRGQKSRDVMRFVFGYYTEKLSEMESHTLLA